MRVISNFWKLSFGKMATPYEITEERCEFGDWLNDFAGAQKKSVVSFRKDKEDLS